MSIARVSSDDRSTQLDELGPDTDPAAAPPYSARRHSALVPKAAGPGEPPRDSAPDTIPAPPLAPTFDEGPPRDTIPSPPPPRVALIVPADGEDDDAPDTTRT